MLLVVFRGSRVGGALQSMRLPSVLASDSNPPAAGSPWGVRRLRTNSRVAGVAVSVLIEVFATGSLGSSAVCDLACGRG